MRASCIFLLGLFAAWHGPVGAAERVRFYADWFPGAQFAGVYLAIDQGYFAAAGLEVTLVPFAFGQNAPATMDADLTVAAIGSAEGYVFLQYRAQEADVRAFTAALRESPTGLISLEPHPVSSARDFAGRTLGVHRYADRMVRWFATEAGLGSADYTLSFIGHDLEALDRGTIAAHQGYATEEFVEARSRFGARARFVSFGELGFSSYAQVLYATRAQLAGHGPALAACIVALRRGWSHALDHPDDALAAVMARLDASADRSAQRARLEALRQYVAPGGETPLGPLDHAKLLQLQEKSAAMGLIVTVEDPAVFCVPLP